MSDENDENEEGVFQVQTVPPPPGETDAYNAPTKVGPMAASVVEEMVLHAKRKAAERPPPSSPTPSAAAVTTKARAFNVDLPVTPIPSGAVISGSAGTAASSAYAPRPRLTPRARAEAESSAALAALAPSLESTPDLVGRSVSGTRPSVNNEAVAAVDAESSPPDPLRVQALLEQFMSDGLDPRSSPPAPAVDSTGSISEPPPQAATSPTPHQATDGRHDSEGVAQSAVASSLVASNETAAETSSMPAEAIRTPARPSNRRTLALLVVVLLLAGFAFYVLGLRRLMH